jgi:hypothetical protein
MMDLISAVFLQIPSGFELPLEWLDAFGQLLHVLYALSIRGYLLLLLGGFIVYATGLSDSLAKMLVGVAVFLYFLGPFATNVVGGFMGIETINMETAAAAWLNLFGMNDAEIVKLLLYIGNIVAATCCLVGAILYLTPTSKDLESRGRSLVVRALLLAPVLVFFQIAPWL